MKNFLTSNAMKSLYMGLLILTGIVLGITLIIYLPWIGLCILVLGISYVIGASIRYFFYDISIFDNEDE